ncbi:hypothetical protein [Variovorax beijingensis]|uniref:Uncharacterized protein n=1 Tax=Variovorax beijingensis TaxID=2496117 RepID=A0ABY0A2R9_9BURK|nr:hypothetical protein [Variovorax beijingensis]RSZ32800.1 hypothetical protein EJO66_20285 [Variovorax beijingensis]
MVVANGVGVSACAVFIAGTSGASDPHAVLAQRPACGRFRVLAAVQRRAASVFDNPARLAEPAMSHDLFPSRSFEFSDVVHLFVREAAGKYRPAQADEVLLAAR